MNSTIPTISPLRQRFLDDMRMRKLCPQDPGAVTSAQSAGFLAG